MWACILRRNRIRLTVQLSTEASCQRMSSITALGGRISVELAHRHSQTATLLTLTHTFISSLSDPDTMSSELSQIGQRPLEKSLNVGKNKFTLRLKHFLRSHSWIQCLRNVDMMVTISVLHFIIVLRMIQFRSNCPTQCFSVLWMHVEPDGKLIFCAACVKHALRSLSI